MILYAKDIMTRLRIFALGSLLCFGVPFCVQADERDYKVEAVFLYNFFNYITWPGYHTPEDLKEATICIADEDPVRPYLEYIQHKRGNEHRLTIRNAKSSASGCQILFVHDPKSVNLSDAAQNGVLLVSTAPNFINNGGMIELSPEEGRMAIEINNSQLTQADFHVSSRLLDLARKVK